MAAICPINGPSEAREIVGLVSRSRAGHEQVDRLIRGMVRAASERVTAKMIARHRSLSCVKG